MNEELPPMLMAIIQAAREMFPGQQWEVVEAHIRRAWNDVAHDDEWRHLRDGARREWTSPSGSDA